MSYFFAIFGDTYLCPIHYVQSFYVLCPIFLDIPTYPKIGDPLWTFPDGKSLHDLQASNKADFAVDLQDIIGT